MRILLRAVYWSASCKLTVSSATVLSLSSNITFAVHVWRPLVLLKHKVIVPLHSAELPLPLLLTQNKGAEHSLTDEALWESTVSLTSALTGAAVAAGR